MSRDIDPHKPLLERVLESVEDAIIAADGNGLTTHFNPAAEQLTGYRAAEILGQGLHDTLHGVAPDGTPIPASACRIFPTSREGLPHSGRDHFRRRDGSFFPVEYVSTPLLDGGKVTGYVVVFRDISERFRIQRQLEELQSRHALAEKMEMTGLMAMSVAHEIKNPLTFIRAGLGILEQRIQQALTLLPASRSGRGSEPPGQDASQNLGLDLAGALDACREGVSRIDDIVNNLRTFSQLDGHDECRVDLEACIAATLMLMRASIPCHVRIHQQIEPVALASGYSSEVNQVLVNLLMNAIQAVSGDGDIWIRLYAKGATAVLEIEDNGPGIDPANLKQIFEPFFTTRHPEQGTGLGLSICRDIVERSGGRIEATSVRGKGSCFRVSLPTEGASA